MKKVTVIGAGIAGLSAAAVLADKGYQVDVYEKNNKAGGRINYFDLDGFRFEMGPSWYWMPEVFENFYNRFGYSASDFYDLRRLDPSYKVVFGQDDFIDIPANFEELVDLFESIEKGSGEKLIKFLNAAAYKYEVGMNEFVWKPSKSIFEFASLQILKNLFKLQLFNPISKEIASIVKDERLRKIIEFPVLFLGATAKNTPSLYSLMNYADLKLGTWYPMGGMYKIAEAFTKIAKEKGVNFHFNAEVSKINTDAHQAKSININGNNIAAELLVCNADYHHVDQMLLKGESSNYSESYWDKRKMAPSSILMFLGCDRKIEGLKHHNLFFDTDFDLHAEEIYKTPKWPTDPLFYVCCPSKTDTTVAPEGKENLFVLIPISTELEEEGIEAINEKYYNMIMKRLEKFTGVKITQHISSKRFFNINDFKNVYNSFKGNAYGLANTLFQTAFLKPGLKNKKLTNLYYTGQLTTPGPGLPPSIISGQVVAKEIMKYN